MAGIGLLLEMREDSCVVVDEACDVGVEGMECVCFPFFMFA